jgi:hypothetical protein
VWDSTFAAYCGEESQQQHLDESLLSPVNVASMRRGGVEKDPTYRPVKVLLDCRAFQRRSKPSAESLELTFGIRAAKSEMRYADASALGGLLESAQSRVTGSDEMAAYLVSGHRTEEADRYDFLWASSDYLDAAPASLDRHHVLAVAEIPATVQIEILDLVFPTHLEKSACLPLDLAAAYD